MNPAVQGYTAAVADVVPPEELAGLSHELVAIDRLLERNPGLRAAMTDSAVPSRARRTVLEELLEGKVPPAARRLAGFAAGAVHAQQVPAAIAWVAARMGQLARHEQVEDPLLGHLEARKRAGGYAAAVYEEVSVRELEEMEDELFRFGRTVGDAPALRAALGNADLPVEVRQGVVDDLLAGKVHPGTLRLARYAVAGGRARDIVGTLEWLAEQTADARGWRVARVRSGQDVDAGERARLTETLTRLAGSPVDLQVTVDPALIAGVEVEIGDLRLDTTVRARLERLRQHVASAGWQDQMIGAASRAERPQRRGTSGHGSD
ncbi:MAG: F0F1 ATP synthase subunit delta [Acidimicrobiales bacterium]